MKVLVVDDEAPARRRMIRMLERAGGVEIVGQAADGVEALTELTRCQPEVVFLDIQMPALDGLALARQARLPLVVFVTAHDEHALAAFELGAADYLLKPVKAARLEATLARLRERLGAEAGPDEDAELRATLARLGGAGVGPGGELPSPRLAVREGESVRLFDARELGRIFASDKYSVFIHEGREQLLDESLSQLELRLSAHGFVRVHRAELVNLAWVRALHGDSGSMSVELRDGQRVKVSRRMVAELKRRLGL